MVVDHAYCLHEGVADRSANELESPTLQIFAHGVGFGGAGRNVLERLPGVLLWLTLHEAPNVLVEAAELPLYSQECIGILDG